MNKWDSDPDIVWKVTVQHHHILGLYYDDTKHILNDFLPLLLKHNFDFYFNGHEHLSAYSNYPYS